MDDVVNAPLARRYHSHGAEHLGTAEAATEKEAIEKGGRAVRHSATLASAGFDEVFSGLHYSALR